ncbi:hypothetical protein ACPC54_39540 [Kitasatospora sp. NPDC094028]
MWIDDIRVGQLPPQGEVAFAVQPGRHRVQVRWLLSSSTNVKNSQKFDILVTPGEVVRFECDIPYSSWRTTPIMLRRIGSGSIPEPSGPEAANAQVLGLTRTMRTEEQLGEDVRLIDNRTSPAPVTRSLKATREWTRALTLGESRSQTTGGQAAAHLLWLSVKGSIEAELQSTLSIAIGSTHLFEEEVSVTVPERTAVRIVLGWKRIWQDGEARVALADRSVHVVPYRLVVSVTFDQRIEDVTTFMDS